MTSERKTTSNRKKRTAGAVAAVLAVMLLLTGTFAWFKTIDALNEFRSTQVKSVVLHDDYDEALIDTDASGWNADRDELTFNKDVYVENTGQVDVYVRIRLDEYMEIYKSSLVSGAVKDDMTTWTPHPYGTGAVSAFEGYWKWEQGGTTEYEKAELSERNGMVDRYAGRVDSLPSAVHKGMTLNGDTMLMSDYNAVSFTNAQREAYVGWILDEADGYAYWSQKLAPGEATGLLLDSVTLIDHELVQAYAGGNKYYDFYYGIHVVMESVDDMDLEAWLDSDYTVQQPVSPEDETYAAGMSEASADAKTFLDFISNP